MPKKGGTGLNDRFDALCELMQKTVDNAADLEEVKKKVCY